MRGERLPGHLRNVAMNAWATVSAAHAIALLYADDPASAIAAAAASGGDTDTIACIVGGIVGARGASGRCRRTGSTTWPLGATSRRRCRPLRPSPNADDPHERNASADDRHRTGRARLIGMTLLPGRRDRISPAGEWYRDFEADIAVVVAWEPSLVITLLEPHEFADSGVPGFEEQMRASGLRWEHLPIRDGGVPGSTFERAWRRVGRGRGAPGGRRQGSHLLPRRSRADRYGRRLIAARGGHPGPAGDR